MSISISVFVCLLIYLYVCIVCIGVEEPWLHLAQVSQTLSAYVDEEDQETRPPRKRGALRKG